MDFIVDAKMTKPPCDANKDEIQCRNSGVFRFAIWNLSLRPEQKSYPYVQNSASMWTRELSINSWTVAIASSVGVTLKPPRLSRECLPLQAPQLHFLQD
jgi:hypothetical protein